MDVTGGLASSLPADIKTLMDRIDALEKQGAIDVQSIADKVIAELKPIVQSGVDSVNTFTLTAGASVQLMAATVQRLNGAVLTSKLEFGPEPGT